MRVAPHVEIRRSVLAGIDIAVGLAPVVGGFDVEAGRGGGSVRAVSRPRVGDRGVGPLCVFPQVVRSFESLARKRLFRVVERSARRRAVLPEEGAGARCGAQLHGADEQMPPQGRSDLYRHVEARDAAFERDGERRITRHSDLLPGGHRQRAVAGKFLRRTDRGRIGGDALLRECSQIAPGIGDDVQLVIGRVKRGADLRGVRVRVDVAGDVVPEALGEEPDVQIADGFLLRGGERTGGGLHTGSVET